MKELILVLAASVADFIFGDPYFIPHPIRYIGKWIKYLEDRIRSSTSNLKLGGFFLLGGSVIGVTAVISIVLRLSGRISPLFSDLLSCYILYTSLASKCLDVEARKVYRELKDGNLEQARIKIGYLVGRETSELDTEEVTRATVETVAENTVDGVLAPLFYIGIGLFLGIPAELVYIYKTVNTLDSMVGYKNEKYGQLGYASAKCDDILNYIPARVGSALMSVAGLMLRYNFKNGIKTIVRDRRNHKSPNCGYPESAVAGLLNIQLGGTNVYFGESVYKPTIGDRIREIRPDDILKAIKIMYIAELLMLVSIAAIYTMKLR